MKLKTTVIASTLLSLAAFSAQAAQELTPEQAESLQPFERISFIGRFNAINDAVAAASKRADKHGADAFYVQAMSDVNSRGNWNVTVDLYHKDAPKVSNEVKLRTFHGVKELTKDAAYSLEPFDTVTVSGLFPTQPVLNEAIGKAAKEKNADSFYIVRQIDVNSSGGNQRVTAYVYKADAPKRQIQSTDLIPADSDAGRAALATGGAAAAKVEIPGVANSGSPSRNVGNFFETQSSKGGRYTVTLSNGTKIEELNNATAAQMVPFDSITFRGNFTTEPAVSEAVAKRAGQKGAKYYHITQKSQNKGSNMTISADLYK
ncbi:MULTISPECIES: DUF1471 family protein YdgH [unclassified Brenneria]|uniref:DUF1471 family protein YdgH n=1 Tax=unclassified Brenneria TaxID=2634434 RepID=UPI001556BA46|nr:MULTISPECIES: DUF1471 family protein YdgH [unclassified Brenneria]MBJ7220824.1 DUF1471 domain-containing protein [Brenneria sp. L3-3C-1]MEE3642064.1 DUF1471 family protein YdgH [Brenneria sp. L3_3C_1]MEE3649239.1 DUF1471 family protein YdgH [Brenneria sp. HEZEL_4_2_4]NPC99192.1 DUF1471 domain-containing protein [Brenneria sp. hezel4-2-4]